MNYIKKVLESGSGASSKRVIAIWSMLLLTAVIICSLIGIVVMETIIYSLVSLVLGSSSLTLINKTKKVYRSGQTNTTPTDESSPDQSEMPEDI